MCGPAAAPIVKGLAAVASNPAFMVGMNVLQWHQGEQVAKAGRRAARHDLTVSDANLLTREGAEAQSAEAEQDRIRREGAIARGAMLAGGVSRGIGRSMALNAMMQEYHSREADHMQGVANRRSQQRLAWSPRLCVPEPHDGKQGHWTGWTCYGCRYRSYAGQDGFGYESRSRR